MLHQRVPKFDTEKLNKLREEYLKAQEAKNGKVEVKAEAPKVEAKVEAPKVEAKVEAPRDVRLQALEDVKVKESLQSLRARK